MDRQSQASLQAAITPGTGEVHVRSTSCKEPAAPTEDTNGKRHGPCYGRPPRPATVRAIKDPTPVGCRPPQQKHSPAPIKKSSSPLLQPAAALRATPHVPIAQGRTRTTYITGLSVAKITTRTRLLETMQPRRCVSASHASQAQQRCHGRHRRPERAGGPQVHPAARVP